MASEEKSALLSEDKPLSGNVDTTSKKTQLAVIGKIGLGAWVLSKSGICSHRWKDPRYAS